LSSRPIRPDEPIAILHHGPDGTMTAPQQGGPPRPPLGPRCIASSADIPCDELLALADGSDIAAQGVVRLDFAKGGPQPTTFAITGGTGRYDNARGQITTKPVGHHEVWTVHLR
jgi:hypothetical protein